MGQKQQAPFPGESLGPLRARRKSDGPVDEDDNPDDCRQVVRIWKSDGTRGTVPLYHAASVCARKCGLKPAEARRALRDGEELDTGCSVYLGIGRR